MQHFHLVIPCTLDNVMELHTEFWEFVLCFRCKRLCKDVVLVPLYVQPLAVNSSLLQFYPFLLMLFFYLGKSGTFSVCGFNCSFFLINFKLSFAKQLVIQ